jgi:hypothetical protein
VEAEKLSKPRPIRIISGSPAVIDSMLNDLGNEYAPFTWTFAVVKEELTITVVMMSASLIRQSQIAQAALANGARR